MGAHFLCSSFVSPFGFYCVSTPLTLITLPPPFDGLTQRIGKHKEWFKPFFFDYCLVCLPPKTSPSPFPFHNKSISFFFLVFEWTSCGLPLSNETASSFCWASQGASSTDYHFLVRAWWAHGDRICQASKKLQGFYGLLPHLFPSPHPPPRATTTKWNSHHHLT